MIQRTLHYLWGKKFAILILALVLILLPNTIGHSLQIRTTTVITNMTIERTSNGILITAEKFKPTACENNISYETITYRGDNVRVMLADVSLAHCTSLNFVGQPDLSILHDLYHFQDLRGNTPVNHDQTINELLKQADGNYH